MLARLVTFVLSLTALAPIAAIWAVKKRAEHGVTFWGPTLFAGVSIAFALILLWRVVPKKSERRVLPVQKSESVDKEVLSFLLAYLLPLIVQSDKPVDWPTTVAVGVVVVMVIWRSQLIHINPLLGLFGFHFFKVSTESGQTHLLITRNSTVAPADLTAFKLSEHLWYEQGKRADP